MAQDSGEAPLVPLKVKRVLDGLGNSAGASAIGWDADSGVWEVHGEPSDHAGLPWSVNAVDDDEAWFVCGEVRISISLRGEDADVAFGRLADLAAAFGSGSIVGGSRRSAIGVVHHVQIPGTLTNGCTHSQSRWMSRTRWL